MHNYNCDNYDIVCLGSISISGSAKSYCSIHNTILCTATGHKNEISAPLQLLATSIVMLSMVGSASSIRHAQQQDVATRLAN